MNFKGETILITGASSGIGQALAVEMNRGGGFVILTARTKEKLERVKSQMPNPKASMVLEIDLSKPESIKNAVETLTTSGKQVSILVNNGGISQRALAKDTRVEVDRKIMEVNYFGAVELTKALLPEMLECNTGRILAISSIAGNFGFPLRSAYSASKHALVGFFESLDLELISTGIMVHIVFPGRVKTNISQGALTGDGKNHNQLDEGQEEGISAEQCAQDIIRGMQKGKPKIYSGGKELWMVKIHKWFPRIFRKLATKISPT